MNKGTIPLPASPNLGGGKTKIPHKKTTPSAIND